jgi:putative two-component system response regulator
MLTSVSSPLPDPSQAPAAGGLSLPSSRPVHIVVAADDADVRRPLVRLLVRAGHAVRTAADLSDIIPAIALDRSHIVLMGDRVGGVPAADLCRRIKAHPAAARVSVVLAMSAGCGDRIAALDAGIDDILPAGCDDAEVLARVRALARRQQAIGDLEPAANIMLSLAMAIEARDPYTRGHCERLARYALMLGEALGLDEIDLATLHRGALLHDVGKVGVPDAVLFKRGALTPAEHAVMREHTVIGDKLCRQLHSIAPVCDVIRHHHERLDGTGYPDRLRGDEIPLTAQIVGVVDLFDAVTTNRPYKQARTADMAMQALRDEVARGWKCGDLVETFAAIVDRTELGRSVA